MKKSTILVVENEKHNTQYSTVHSGTTEITEIKKLNCSGAVQVSICFMSANRL